MYWSYSIISKIEIETIILYVIFSFFADKDKKNFPSFEATSGSEEPDHQQAKKPITCSYREDPSVVLVIGNDGEVTQENKANFNEDITREQLFTKEGPNETHHRQEIQIHSGNVPPVDIEKLKGSRERIFMGPHTHESHTHPHSHYDSTLHKHRNVYHGRYSPRYETIPPPTFDHLSSKLLQDPRKERTYPHDMKFKRREIEDYPPYYHDNPIAHMYSKLPRVEVNERDFPGHERLEAHNIPSSITHHNFHPSYEMHSRRHEELPKSVFSNNNMKAARVIGDQNSRFPPTYPKPDEIFYEEGLSMPHRILGNYRQPSKENKAVLGNQGRGMSNMGPSIDSLPAETVDKDHHSDIKDKMDHYKDNRDISGSFPGPPKQVKIVSAKEKEDLLRDEYNLGNMDIEIVHMSSDTENPEKLNDDGSSGNPFICGICGKGFSWAVTLRRHMNIHLGIRQYKCHTCGKAFNRSHHLKRHVTTHTGEKPYVCKYCGKAYSRSDRLNQHINATHADIKQEVKKYERSAKDSGLPKLMKDPVLPKSLPGPVSSASNVAASKSEIHHPTSYDTTRLSYKPGTDNPPHVTENTLHVTNKTHRASEDAHHVIDNVPHVADNIALVKDNAIYVSDKFVRSSDGSVSEIFSRPIVPPGAIALPVHGKPVLAPNPHNLQEHVQLHKSNANEFMSTERQKPQQEFHTTSYGPQISASTSMSSSYPADSSLNESRGTTQITPFHKSKTPELVRFSPRSVNDFYSHQGSSVAAKSDRVYEKEFPTASVMPYHSHSSDNAYHPRRPDKVQDSLPHERIFISAQNVSSTSSAHSTSNSKSTIYVADTIYVASALEKASSADKRFGDSVENSREYDMNSRTLNSHLPFQSVHGDSFSHPIPYDRNFVHSASFSSHPKTESFPHILKPKPPDVSGFHHSSPSEPVKRLQNHNIIASGRPKSTDRPRHNVITGINSQKSDLRDGADKKIYKCRVCGRGFTRSHHLRRHEMIHTGEKPYKCHFCERGFARSDHLNLHLASHFTNSDGSQTPGGKVHGNSKKYRKSKEVSPSQVFKSKYSDADKGSSQDDDANKLDRERDQGVNVNEESTKDKMNKPKHSDVERDGCQKDASRHEANDVSLVCVGKESKMYVEDSKSIPQSEYQRRFEQKASEVSEQQGSQHFEKLSEIEQEPSTLEDDIGYDSQDDDIKDNDSQDVSQTNFPADSGMDSTKEEKGINFGTLSPRSEQDDEDDCNDTMSNANSEPTMVPSWINTLEKSDVDFDLSLSNSDESLGEMPTEDGSERVIVQKLHM